jgi:hypothetical protein
LLACIAKEFGVLPSQVDRAVNQDPDQTDMKCLFLVRYHEAYAAYKRADAKELKKWKGKEVMAQVEANGAPTPEELAEAGQPEGAGN